VIAGSPARNRDDVAARVASTHKADLGFGLLLKKYVPTCARPRRP
jgi:hypothetical protein